MKIAEHGQRGVVFQFLIYLLFTSPLYIQGEKVGWKVKVGDWVHEGWRGEGGVHFHIHKSRY